VGLDFSLHLSRARITAQRHPLPLSHDHKQMRLYFCIHCDADTLHTAPQHATSQRHTTNEYTSTFLPLRRRHTELQHETHQLHTTDKPHNMSNGPPPAKRNRQVHNTASGYSQLLTLALIDMTSPCPSTSVLARNRTSRPSPSTTISSLNAPHTYATFACSRWRNSPIRS